MYSHNQNTHTRTNTHTQIHTYTHASTYTHAHTQAVMPQLLPPSLGNAAPNQAPTLLTLPPIQQASAVTPQNQSPTHDLVMLAHGVACARPCLDSGQQQQQQQQQQEQKGEPKQQQQQQQQQQGGAQTKETLQLRSLLGLLLQEALTRVDEASLTATTLPPTPTHSLPTTPTHTHPLLTTPTHTHPLLTTPTHTHPLLTTPTHTHPLLTTHTHPLLTTPTHTHPLPTTPTHTDAVTPNSAPGLAQQKQRRCAEKHNVDDVQKRKVDDVHKHNVGDVQKSVGQQQQQQQQQQQEEQEEQGREHGSGLSLRDTKPQQQQQQQQAGTDASWQYAFSAPPSKGKQQPTLVRPQLQQPPPQQQQQRPQSDQQQNAQQQMTALEQITVLQQQPSTLPDRPLTHAPLTPDQMATLLWTATTLRLTPPPQWTHSLLRYLTAVLPTAPMSAVTITLRALGDGLGDGLRVNPGTSVFRTSQALGAEFVVWRTWCVSLYVCVFVV